MKLDILWDHSFSSFCMIFQKRIAQPVLTPQNQLLFCRQSTLRAEAIFFPRFNCVQHVDRKIIITPFIPDPIYLKLLTVAAGTHSGC